MDEQEWMIHEQIERRGIRSQRVLEAMRAVPRAKFVPATMQAEAYADAALPIDCGQTISQPYMVALMTEALDVRPADRVLEIGTGSGYQTAILAHLAAEVYTVERIGELLHQARRTLAELEIRNVEYRLADGTLGWHEKAPFERILIAAAAPEIPRKLLMGQLAEGGVAVLPAAEAGRDWQILWRIKRRGGELLKEDLGGCRFVPLIGEEGYHPGRGPGTE